jgi:hypothetical protein
MFEIIFFFLKYSIYNGSFKYPKELIEGMEVGKIVGDFVFLSNIFVGEVVAGDFVGVDEGSLVGLLEVGLTVGWFVG